MLCTSGRESITSNYNQLQLENRLIIWNVSNSLPMGRSSAVGYFLYACVCRSAHLLCHERVFLYYWSNTALFQQTSQPAWKSTWCSYRYILIYLMKTKTLLFGIFIFTFISIYIFKVIWSLYSVKYITMCRELHGVPLSNRLTEVYICISL